jgi:hypothetical protein
MEVVMQSYSLILNIERGILEMKMEQIKYIGNTGEYSEKFVL